MLPNNGKKISRNRVIILDHTVVNFIVLDTEQKSKSIVKYKDPDF